MAQFYETGSASDFNDLLGKVRTALAANGWTTHHNGLEGSSGGTRVHMSKAGLYVNLRTGFNNEVPVANAAERSTRIGTWRWNYTWFVGGVGTQVWQPDWICMNVGTGYNGSVSWHNQPGCPGASESKGLAVMATGKGAISRYWLFVLENPDAVFLVMEVQPGKTCTFSWGRALLNQPVASGGEWFTGGQPFHDHYTGINTALWGSMVSGSNSGSGFCRLVDPSWDATDQLDGWNHGFFTNPIPNSYGSGSFYGNLGLPNPDSTIGNPSASGYYNAISSGYIASEGRSVLTPIAMWKAKSSGNGYTLLGHMPHAGYISMIPYIPGDEVAGLGEAFLAFAHHQRLSPANVLVSGVAPADPNAQSFNYYCQGIAIRRP